MDYLAKIDDVLDIIGIETKPHIDPRQKENSLRQLCALQKSGSTISLQSKKSCAKPGSRSKPRASLVTSGEASQSIHGDNVITGRTMATGNLEVAADVLDLSDPDCGLCKNPNSGSKNIEERTQQDCKAGEYVQTDDPSIATTPDSGVTSLVSIATDDLLSHVDSEDELFNE